MRNRWALKALLPWLAASGLLISFTASAGYAPPEPESFVLAAGSADITGSIQTHAARSGKRTPETMEDHAVAIVAQGFAIRPAALVSFEEPIIYPTPIFPPSTMLFEPETALSSTGIFSTGTFDGVAFAYDGFMPRVLLEMPRLDGGTDTQIHADLAPGSASQSATSPTLFSAIAARAPDGATPAIPRAITLASATPAPSEPEIVIMPIVGMSVASMSVASLTVAALPNLGSTKSTELRLAAIQPTTPALPAPSLPVARNPNYGDLIDPRHTAREQKCLAEAIYFEARSEPAAGQAAVAQVVLNRVRSGLYPTTVCGVVYQNRHRYMGCQFSFACEGKSLRITEPAPWKQAVGIAKAVTEGKTYLSGVGNATHYHANYVRPTWSRRLKKTDKIGTHIFYRLRPGQA